MTAIRNATQAVSRQFELNATPQSIWHWWSAEAQNAYPAWLSRLLAPHARVLSIRMVETGFTVWEQMGTPGGGASNSTPNQLLWGDVKALVAARRKTWGTLLRVDVHLPLSRCLVLQHRLPADALVRAPAILSLELERLTPLRRADVLQDFYVSERGPASGGTTCSLLVEHIVVKTSAIEPVFSELVDLGGIDSIRIDRDSGEVLPVDLAKSIPTRRADFRARLNQALVAAAALAALTMIIQTGREIWSLSNSLDSLSQSERSLKQQIVEVRKKLTAQDSLQGRIKSLKLRKMEQVTTLQVWEEITQLLPSSAWISEMRIEDGMLHLDGFARSASELVGIFARSNLFTKVEFGSPVTRDSQQGVERFQLRMKIERRTRTQLAPVAVREGTR